MDGNGMGCSVWVGRVDLHNTTHTTQNNTVVTYLLHFLLKHMDPFWKELKEILKLLILLEAADSALGYNSL